VSPNSNNFVTVGADNTLRLWDVKGYKSIKVNNELDKDVRAIDWSSNGEFMVMADIKGMIYLIDPESL